jgi:hypothetical protein
MSADVHPVPVGRGFRRFGKIEKYTFLIYRNIHRANINIEMQFVLFSTFTTQKAPNTDTKETLTVTFILFTGS